jgi:hypothetical protein
MAPCKKRSTVQASLFASFAGKNDAKKAKWDGGRPKVFCDLDGVLTDFDAGVRKLFGRAPEELNSNELWSAVSRAENFYRDLPWTADGEELWEALRPLRPHILTGIPHSKSAARNKFEWCQRELCVEVVWRNMADFTKGRPHKRQNERRENEGAVCNVITCWSRNKHLECRPGYVLIDDRGDHPLTGRGMTLKQAWEAAGGIFVQHNSTEQTLKILREKGILAPPATTPAVERMEEPAKVTPSSPQPVQDKEAGEDDSAKISPSSPSAEQEDESLDEKQAVEGKSLR